MGLKITDGMLIKAKYELDLLQPDDSAYDIIDIIISDECYDEYTKGFLSAKLEEWAESLDGKHLLQQFVDYLWLVRG
jgi:hypothetical protein